MSFNSWRSRSELVEKRAAELDQETGTFRCAHCGWSFVGTMSAGIVAARLHRRAEHPSLPVRSPRLPKPGQKTPDPAPSQRQAERKAAAAEQRAAARSELRDRILAALEEAGQPLTAKELASRLDDGLTKGRVSSTLAWARKHGTPLHRVGDAWAWGEGPDVRAPELQPIHEQILAALEGAGSEGMLAEEVGKRVGLNAVAGANYLKFLLTRDRVVKVSDRRGARRWALAGLPEVTEQPSPGQTSAHPPDSARVDARAEKRRLREEAAAEQQCLREERRRERETAAAEKERLRQERLANPPICETCGKTHRRGNAFLTHEEWDESRRRMSETMRKKYADDPEFRRRVSEGTRRAMTPRVRVKLVAAHARRRAEKVV